MTEPKFGHASTGAGGGDEDGYNMATGTPKHSDVRNWANACGASLPAALTRYIDAQEARDAALQAAEDSAEYNGGVAADLNLKLGVAQSQLSALQAEHGHLVEAVLAILNYPGETGRLRDAVGSILYNRLVAALKAQPSPSGGAMAGDDDEERDPVNGQLVSARVGQSSAAEPWPWLYGSLGRGQSPPPEPAKEPAKGRYVPDWYCASRGLCGSIHCGEWPGCCVHIDCLACGAQKGQPCKPPVAEPSAAGGFVVGQWLRWKPSGRVFQVTAGKNLLWVNAVPDAFEPAEPTNPVAEPGRDYVTRDELCEGLAWCATFSDLLNHLTQGRE